MGEIIDTVKWSSFRAARVIFETTCAHDIEERIGELIYENTQSVLKLEAENAAMKTALEHILRVTPLMGNSKNVEYIAAVCRNALGKEVM